MLTIYADAMLTASRRGKWSAPDHWTTKPLSHGESQNARERAHWLRKTYRNVGMW